MIKTKIKCTVDYADLNGIFNNEIYNYTGGGWDSRTLATCLNCGELFIYDEQELHFKKLTLRQRIAGQNCPKCMSLLDKTIEKYPDSFRTKNGKIGHKIYTSLPADNDSVTIEIWDLFS
jgi:hypothetical protein